MTSTKILIFGLRKATQLLWNSWFPATLNTSWMGVIFPKVAETWGNHLDILATLIFVLESPSSIVALGGPREKLDEIIWNWWTIDPTHIPIIPFVWAALTLSDAFFRTSRNTVLRGGYFNSMAQNAAATMATKSSTNATGTSHLGGHGVLSNHPIGRSWNRQVFTKFWRSYLHL